MLIPYLGDKSKHTDLIIPNLPNSFTKWVEPFGGGFGLYFTLNLNDYPGVQFIYNDINHYNYLLFKHLKNPEFIQRVKEYGDDKIRGFFMVSGFPHEQIYVLENSTDEFKIAFAWLILLCCSTITHLGQYCGNSRLVSFKAQIDGLGEHLSQLDVYGLDYKEIVEKFDSPDTFFYLDPPYLGKEKYYLNHSFTRQSHKELSDILKGIQGKFMLSYYWFEDLEEWYRDCRFESKKTPPMGTEFIIMNY